MIKFKQPHFFSLLYRAIVIKFIENAYWEKKNVQQKRKILQNNPFHYYKSSCKVQFISNRHPAKLQDYDGKKKKQPENKVVMANCKYVPVPPSKPHGSEETTLSNCLKQPKTNDNAYEKG